MRRDDPRVEERAGVELARQVHDAVRARPALGAALAAGPSTSTSTVEPTCAHPLEGDRLLQRDEPVEPLLHDLLRDLVVHEGGARAGLGEYWNVYAWSNRRASTTSSVSAKSSSVSPGNPTMMSVLTAMSGIAARIRSSQPRYRSRR